MCGRLSEQTNPRYMIDYETYNSIHGADEGLPKQLSEAEMFRQGVDINSDEQSDDFYKLLPSTLKGFAFHDKRWRTYVPEILLPSYKCLADSSLHFSQAI